MSIGSTNYGVKTLAAALGWHGGTLGGTASDGGSLVRQVIFELRLPRALNAFSTGGLLALAGVLMQVLLRNPLADPYVLGISGGAAVAALVLAIWLFGDTSSGGHSVSMPGMGISAGRAIGGYLFLLSGLAAGVGAVLLAKEEKLF